ncbi:MAG: response regulator [Planctomycetaceae bacterium]|nr:response regulator [Planctomycetales bacterium]MCB9927491.1 response regulator [Planctomycetaceae bacterium]
MKRDAIQRLEELINGLSLTPATETLDHICAELRLEAEKVDRLSAAQAEAIVHSAMLLSTGPEQMRGLVCSQADAIVNAAVIINDYEDALADMKKALTEVRNDLKRRDAEFDRLSKAQAEAIVNSAIIIDELEVTKEQLELASRKANAATLAKSQFLANMSHEIRTPLNGILGFTELLLRRDDNLTDDDRRTYLNTVHTSGKHLLTLINDILDLSKIDAGRMNVEKVVCSPVDIIAEVCSLLKANADEKSIALQATACGGLVSEIESDPARLRQLLINLVGNAIKFTDRGIVEVKHEIVDIDTEPKLRIEVIDTGIGIASDRVTSVFEPFVQADNSVTRQFGGTGLGLTISKKIVEALGGSLHVRSEVGRGTTFTVDLPATQLIRRRNVVDPMPLLPNAAQTTNHINSVTGLPARILVVEDGRTNQMLLQAILEEVGAKVSVADNGQIGVDLANRDHFDLILMDMQMPVMDGYTATGLLRDKGFDAPIIALTAHAMSGDEAKCRAAGCSHYLSKPIDRDKLLELVAATLGDEYTQHSEQSIVTNPKLVSTLSLSNPVVRKVVESFVLQLAEQLSELQLAWRAEGNLAKVREVAHWLKGAGITVGFAVLTERGEVLEQLAREGRVDEIDQQLHDLCELVQRIDMPVAGTVISVREKHGASSTKATSIVVAEDDPVTLRLMTLWLENGGYDVHPTANGKHALDAIRTVSPDIIITDWSMPELSGIELCQEVRKQPVANRPYILFATAKTSPGEVQRALDSGSDDFFGKPISEDELLARVRQIEHTLQRQNRQITLAETDGLTGLLNRRRFEELAERENSRALRSRKTYSCIVIDLDLFKSINDTHGHSRGDEALRTVAQVLQSQCRRGDIVCRYGGDEFCVLLPETPESAAAKWASRVQREISATVLKTERSTIELRATLGVAEWRDDIKVFQELFDLADQALLAAKQGGRNMVQTSSNINEHEIPDALPSLRLRTSLSDLRARDVMTSPVACIRETASVKNVAELCLQLRINSLPVTNENGQLVGIVSERDVLSVSLDESKWDTPVRDVMTTAVVTYEEETPLITIWNFLRRVTIRRIVVVRDGEPMGVISRGSLLRWMANWEATSKFRQRHDDFSISQNAYKSTVAAIERHTLSLKHMELQPSLNTTATVVGAVSKIQDHLIDLLGFARLASVDSEDDMPEEVPLVPQT